MHIRDRLKNYGGRYLAGLLIGAGAGFAYYYFIGCNSGGCPITSSPVISTLYGGAAGMLVAWK